MKQETKFKDTEIGMIPEEWDVVKTKDVVDVLTGFPFKGNMYSNKGLTVLRGENVSLGHLRWNTLKKWNHSLEGLEKYYLKESDVVLGMDGSRVGKNRAQIRKHELPLILAQRVARLRAKNNLCQDFMAYIILSRNFYNYIEAVKTGTSIPHISAKQISDFEFPLPPLPEQTAIAKILSDFDSKIELLQKQNKTLEAIAQVLFKHWFVDFEFPNEEGNPYKSSGGEMVFNEELGKEIPKGWEVKNLGEFLNVIKGCSYKSEDLKESDKALITLKSINRDGGFNQKGYKEYVGDYKEEQIVKDGDIVVAQTDLTQAAEVIGTPAIVNSLNRYNELIASLDLQILRIKEKLNKGFAYFLLKTAMFHNHALSYTNGTTVLHLNKNAVPDFKFTLPNENILGKFGKIAEQILEKGDKNEKEVYILSQIRDSLLPKLMSGKIRVLNNQKIKEAV